MYKYYADKIIHILYRCAFLLIERCVLVVHVSLQWQQSNHQVPRVKPTGYSCITHRQSRLDFRLGWQTAVTALPPDA